MLLLASKLAIRSIYHYEFLKCTAAVSTVLSCESINSTLLKFATLQQIRTFKTSTRSNIDLIHFWYPDELIDNLVEVLKYFVTRMILVLKWHFFQSGGRVWKSYTILWYYGHLHSPCCNIHHALCASPRNTKYICSFCSNSNTLPYRCTEKSYTFRSINNHWNPKQCLLNGHKCINC